MAQVIAQELMYSAPPASLPTNAQIIERTGTGSLKMMNRQSALLCLVTHSLMEKAGLQRPLGPRFATYCTLDTESNDSRILESLKSSHSTLAKNFMEKISPLQSLREMTVSQAFWSSAVSGAEGPLRVFLQSSHAQAQARAQAELDLREGICNIAFVLSVSSTPESVSGILLAASPGGPQ